MSKKIDFSKPLSEVEAAYVKDRPWMVRDAELSGFTVRLAGDEPEADEADDEEGVDYSELTKAELKEEIARRNEDRDEDSQIEPASDKNDDLRAALIADDEADDE